MPSQQGTSFLPEEDLLNSILNELKRTVREYTTATTEASCPAIRRMFSELTAETLQMQGDLYQLIERQKQYPASVPTAIKADVDKQLQAMQQTSQATRDFTAQRTSGLESYSHTPNVASHPTNVQPGH
ncbi:spore coat protein [Paenibacillus sp. F411]|uniref:Coat F domain protein n=1 Tax=Paenibacillus algicola TaxID=2565926 RepID=A0A4P8XQ05_9BACL|nr:MULTISPECIES: spore coat protein [Paenibacillus]MBO2943508.1 spore coat protein [Paenibacillus sp. F411]QCT03890.1 Coat F domain protein [Paenibacillus algicola]